MTDPLTLAATGLVLLVIAAGKLTLWILRRRTKRTFQ
jgi:hypothetical protein